MASSSATRQLSFPKSVYTTQSFDGNDFPAWELQLRAAVGNVPILTALLDDAPAPTLDATTAAVTADRAAALRSFKMGQI